MFSEAFEQYGGKISKDALLVVEGEIQHDEYNGSMALRASRILTIDEARQRFSRVLHLDFLPHRCQRILICVSSTWSRITVPRTR